MRRFKFITGRKGAIDAEVKFRVDIYKAANVSYNEKNIREEVEKMTWKKGMYEVTDLGIRYIGDYGYKK